MRGKGSTVVTIAIGLFLVLAVFPMVSHSADLGEDVRYVPHAPIRINSNADFPAIATSGNGNPGTPWIIENYDINGAGYSYRAGSDPEDLPPFSRQ